jgi:HlyD family secretion protein
MKKTYWIILIVAAIGLAVAAYFIFGKKTETAVEFRTGKVEKGDLQIVVTATGTLSADTTVAVGTQVSGIITKIFVDFNSFVKKGQIIAVLDTTFLAASVEDARSSLFRAQVQTRLTKRNYERNKTLMEEKVIAQSDYDQSLSDYETAQANERSVKSSLDRALINLRYATIQAPVSGVVISRNVDIGQTVAASFSTPTLFSIANDLTKMQLQASIDEADIGKIQVGQDVTFRVDAYVDQTFSGRVRQVRLQPVTLQNVVNYTVVIDVPNPDLKLMPGMTANLTVKIQEALNVMKAPSAALRFWPPQEYLDKHMKEYPDSIQKMIERMKQFMARRQSGQGSGGQGFGSGQSGSDAGTRTGNQQVSATQGGSSRAMAANAQPAQGNQQTAGEGQKGGMQEQANRQPGMNREASGMQGQGGRMGADGMQRNGMQGQRGQGQRAAQNPEGGYNRQGRTGTQAGDQNRGQGYNRQWQGSRQGGQNVAGNAAAKSYTGNMMATSGQAVVARPRIGLVWVKQGDLLIPHRIKTGISDNSSTEVEGSLKEGDEVVTGVVNTNPGQQATQQQNPFAPSMGRPQTGGSSGRGGR